jgi:hypothetical protein
VIDRGVELRYLAWIDAMAERGVDDDGEERGGMLGHEGLYGFDQLSEARHRPTLGREIRAIDHDVLGHDDCSQPPSRAFGVDASRADVRPMLEITTDERRAAEGVRARSSARDSVIAWLLGRTNR